MKQLTVNNNGICCQYGLLISTLLVLLSGCASSDDDYASYSQPPLNVQTNAVNSGVRSGLTEPPDRSAVKASTFNQLSAEQMDDYQIGPQDLLEIKVFGVEELSGEVRVNGRGFISAPLIGVVDANGLTSEELAARLESKYSEQYLQNPSVTVFVKEFTSQRVTIDGAVRSPGVYATTGSTSLAQGIALAGGLAKRADEQDVRIFRELSDGERVMLKYDLSKIRKGDQEDPMMEGNDVLIVGRSGARTFLTDSLFRDTVDLLNPFRLLML